MKNLWTVMFSFILVACLIQACDSDPDDLGNVVIPVYCTGDKADDPACVNPDATESPPGDDIWSSDTDDLYVEPPPECIPMYPDGTWVQCGYAHFPCQILMDMTECTLSCWKSLGEPPPAFVGVQQDVAFSPKENGVPWCVPIDEQ